MQPGWAESSSEGRPFGDCDDGESPRRRPDSDVKKSEDAELVLAWVGVELGVDGGVMAMASCIFGECEVFIVLARVLVGESGGVMCLRNAGLESPPAGAANRYPSLTAGLVSS